MESKTEDFILLDIINMILNKIILSSHNKIKQDIINTCYITNITKYTYDISDCLDNQIKDEIEYTCCICINLFEEPRLLPCGHSVCKNCLLSCRQNKCPLCRKYFLKEQLVPNNSISEIINKLIVKCTYCGKNHEIGYKCKNIRYEFYCKNCCYKNKMNITEFIDHYITCCLAQCLYCNMYDFKKDIWKHENKCSENYMKIYIKYIHKTNNNMNNLSSDILYKICDYLDYSSKHNICHTSQYLSKIIYYV
jgi:hypothetical protein